MCVCVCGKLIKLLCIADSCDTFHIWINEPVTDLSGEKKELFESFGLSHKLKVLMARLYHEFFLDRASHVKMQ